MAFGVCLILKGILELINQQQLSHIAICDNIY